MISLRQIKEELPIINRIHMKRPQFRRILRADAVVTPVDIEGTREYIKNNTVTAHSGRKCVDGRYTPDVASGMLARAGGDCGYVMALLAINKKKKLGMTPEQCFNAVFKVIRQKMHDDFCMHTDHHVDPEHAHPHTKDHQTSIGCGHLAKAASQRLRRPYDVTSADVKKIIAYARNLADIGDNVDIVNLEGEHKEEGVLLINDDMHTVNAWSKDKKSMYFIYDKKRDEEFMKKLVKEMAIEKVTFEDMKQESDIQLQATLHNLAKGLPLYQITYTDHTPHVSYVMTIQ